MQLNLKFDIWSVKCQSSNYTNLNDDELPYSAKLAGGNFEVFDTFQLDHQYLTPQIV